MVGLKMGLLRHSVTVLFEIVLFISHVVIYSSQSLSKQHVLKCLVLFEMTVFSTLQSSFLIFQPTKYPPN